MIHKGKISAGNSNTKHGSLDPGTRQRPEARYARRTMTFSGHEGSDWLQLFRKYSTTLNDVGHLSF